MIAEPTCAALSHIAQLAKTNRPDLILQQNKILVVFDLGGGTFDTAIIRLSANLGIHVGVVSGILFALFSFNKNILIIT